MLLNKNKRLLPKNNGWVFSPSELLDCPPGYYGKNCSNICKQPYYGMSCLNECNCSESECNPIFGCNDSVTSPIPGNTQVRTFHHIDSGLTIDRVWHIQIGYMRNVVHYQ